MTARRGFTLIEIMITLTVILMMSSWLAANYYSFTENERNEEAARHIEQIKTAIVNYAATSTTEPRVLEVVNLAIDTAVPLVTTTLTVRVSIPAGRPYLPCPDIDGDGLEDRVLLSVSVSVISLTVGTGAIFPASSAYPLENAGGCASSRGVVPWRTLDTPESDPWLNRYSYRVAGVFSNAQTGFDQHATGGAHYAMRPFVSDGGVVRVQNLAMTVFSLNSVSIGTIETGFHNYLSPAVICSGAPCPPPSAASTVSVVAGELATVAVDTTLTLTSAHAADFDAAVETHLTVGELISGIPFVVLSHGKNGYGAVSADAPVYVCGSTLDASPEEIQNAIFVTEAAIPDQNLPGGRYRCPAVPATPTADTHREQAGFVAADYNDRVGNDDYDDIVGWMSLPDLIADLSERGTLPAHLLPPLGLEQ